MSEKSLNISSSSDLRQYEESGRAVDVQKEGNLQKIACKELQLKKQLEEMCCKHRDTVEEHKQVICQLQDIAATNAQLQECFLRTEVSLQKQKDKYEKLEIKTANETNHLQMEMEDLASEMAMLSKKLKSTNSQLVATQKVVQKQTKNACCL